jgi:hypothetical protein
LKIKVFQHVIGFIFFVPSVSFSIFDSPLTLLTDQIMKVFLLVFACFFGLSAAAQEEACKVTVPPTIDGNADEWTATWQDDEKGKFKYNICSDDANLYIRVQMLDPIVQRKVAMYGFTVWLNPDGKKKPKLGLRYPTGIEGEEHLEEYRKSGDSFNKENNLDKREEKQKEFKKSLITGVEVLELIGLSDKPVTSSKSGITNGLLVAIDMDDKENYVYEATIPFKSFRLSKADISKLGVGFETGKMVVKQTKGQGNNAGGGMQPGGFGGGGYGNRGYGSSGIGYGGYGAGGGGGYPSRSGMYSAMTSPTKMWTTVKLSQ